MKSVIPFNFCIIFLALLFCKDSAVIGQELHLIKKSATNESLPGTWPVLKHYDQTHLARIAFPVGGIGTGTVSLGGRGNLKDWEIMNRPAKGFVPDPPPFFAIYTEQANGKIAARALEGPLELEEYEGYSGSQAPNHGLPRFQKCSFDATYPFARVYLSDRDLPVDVNLEAFNPFIPGDEDASGIPVAVLLYKVKNKTDDAVKVSICGNIPNFIGNDGSLNKPDWLDMLRPIGENKNINTFRFSKLVQGIYMTSEGVDSSAAQWGTMALVTLPENVTTHRLCWLRRGWGGDLLDFWDDFSQDGRLENRKTTDVNKPMASLAVQLEIPVWPHRTRPGNRRGVALPACWRAKPVVAAAAPGALCHPGRNRSARPDASPGA